MTDSDKRFADLMSIVRTEFIDEAEDNIKVIQGALDHIHTNDRDPLESIVIIRRCLHNMKGTANVADFPMVAIIAHRFEDYLSILKAVEEQHLDDVYKYLDYLIKYAKPDADQNDVPSADLVRILPQRPDVEGNVVDISIDDSTYRIEALMVVKNKITGMIFEKELISAGLSVTTIHDSFSAFEMITRTKPDLVLLSGMIDVLSGVDLACAIKGMPVTRDTSVCIMTSFEKGSHELKNLPDNVYVVNKSNMKHDLDEMLQEVLQRKGQSSSAP